MSELQVLYTEEELREIDLQIERQMSVQVERQVQNSILTNLVSLIGQIDYSQFDGLIEKISSLPQELVTCQLFYHLDTQFKEEKSQLIAFIAARNEIISQMKSKELQQIQSLIDEACRVAQRQKEILELRKKLTKVNEHSYLQQQAILNQKKQIDQLTDIINEKELTLKQKNQENQAAIINWDEQQKQYQNKLNSALVQIEALKEQLSMIHEELEDEIESKRISLITHTIQAEQISLNYQEVVNFYSKSQKIMTQNRKITSFLAQLQKKLVTYELKELNISLKQLQSPYEALVRQIVSYQTQICNLRELLEPKIVNQIQINKDLASKLRHYEQALAKSLSKVSEHQKRQKIQLQKIEILENTIHHLTDSNYKILIDLQQTKAKIEDSYLKECELSKSLTLELESLKKLNLSTAAKVEILQADLQNERQLNEEMNKKLNNSQIKSVQLQEIYLNLKNSINNELQSYGKDENSQLQLVEHLIQKNQELMKELALTKSKLSSLDFEKENINDIRQSLRKQLVQKMETVEFTLKTNKILNQENQKLQTTLKQKDIEISYLQQQMCQKQKEIFALKDQTQTLGQAISIKQQTDQQVQTQNKVRESQIRKQKLGSQVISLQHSQSCFEISDDQQLKQNTLSYLNKANNPNKFKYRKNAEQSEAKVLPCNHLEKIAALNEIINYFMNYIKGYMGGSIRPNSWLSSKIAKHGNEYESKLFDETNIAPKIKNIKKIEEICVKEAVCGKLISEFQSIMDFYFDQPRDILREKSLNGTISKSRANSTVNKYNFYDKTEILYSRVHK